MTKDLGIYEKKIKDQQKKINELKQELSAAELGVKEINVGLQIIINSFVNAFGSAEDDQTVLKMEAATLEDTMQYDFETTLEGTKYVITRRKRENGKDEDQMDIHS